LTGATQAAAFRSQFRNRPIYDGTIEEAGKLGSTPQDELLLGRGCPMKIRRSISTGSFIFLLAFFTVLTARPSQPQERVPGVTKDTIEIGSCSALSGPASFLGMQTQLGAIAYFHLINDQGGVNGRRLELQSADDGYDPEKTAECYHRLTTRGVFAMGFFVGTPTAVKYVPMAESGKIPVVGLFTGAQLLYEPFKHYIINVRASYFDETRVQIENLWQARGVRKIGVIYQDDAFGKAVLDGVDHALAKHESKPVALGTFPRNTLEVGEGVKAVRAEKPEAVVLVGPYAPVAAILKHAHAEGWNPLFLTVSFVGTEGLIRAAEKDAEGIIVTQVVPPYDRTDLPTIQLYREALDKYMGGTPPSFVSLEGFVDAMVMVEGLRRTGKDLTREKFIRAIETIHDKDVGLGPKFLLDYGAKDHKGFDSVYATIIRNGRAIVITDWKNLPTE
jgi:branched-chain amino acid transport system substrate-binding protein